MAITVGVDTYADLTYLNTYLNLDFQSRTAWNALSVDNKELYAKMSTQFLDKQRWVGKKTDSSQELAFPRYFGQYVDDPARILNYMEYQYYASEDDGTTTTLQGYENSPYYANSDIIFTELKKAQAEIIIHFLVYEKDASLIKLIKMKDAGIDSFSVSSLSFNFNSGANDDLPLPKEAYKLMKFYLLDVGDIHRLERG